MNRAYNLTRREICYRHEAFSAGLHAAGYEVRDSIPARAAPGDVLLIWNRYFVMHNLATKFEQDGGTVIVAENGYVGPGGVSPVLMQPRSVYALARGYHNDAEVVVEGGPERWDALGAPVAPWRATGEHILICPNRPFGTPGRAMSPDWARDVRLRLEKLTSREIRYRPHPENAPPKKPLAEDFKDCRAVVIWSSSAGVHALLAGIPVFCEAPHWICKSAAHRTLDRINDPVPMVSLRAEALRRLAWAQFLIEEIASGYAFETLLNQKGKVAA